MSAFHFRHASNRLCAFCGVTRWALIWRSGLSPRSCRIMRFAVLRLRPPKIKTRTETAVLRNGDPALVPRKRKMGKFPGRGKRRTSFAGDISCGRLRVVFEYFFDLFHSLSGSYHRRAAGSRLAAQRVAFFQSGNCALYLFFWF